MSTVVQTKPPISADADDRHAPLVSVVIPCLNEAENIEVCVAAALGALRDGAISGEVLVVDNASEDDSAALAAAAGARVVLRAPARLRQRLSRRLRGGERQVHRDGRRRPDVRLQRDPPLRRRAERRRGAGDGRPHGQHPARRDAVAASLHRQPAALGAAELLLPHGRQGRPLRHAGAAPRRAAPSGPAHDRHGVRLGDGDPRLQGAPEDRRVPDRIPPARGRIEAVELPRRLAPSALPAGPQPHAPVHRCRARCSRAWAR